MGAYVTVNGCDAFTAVIGMPRVGCWHADLAVAPDKEIPRGTKVSILVGDDRQPQVELKGTVKRGDRYLDTTIIRVAGGAGGLGKRVGAQAFRNTPLRLVLRSTLEPVGEVLSASSDPGTLSTALAHWSRHEMVASSALRAALAGFQQERVIWRVLADGSVYVGPDAFPPTRLQDFELLGEDPRLDSRTIFAPTPNVFPGETVVFDPDQEPFGRQVSRVELRADEHGIRQQLYLETQT